MLTNCVHLQQTNIFVWGLHSAFLLQKESNSDVVYWPSEIGTSMEFESMIISNNSNSVDSKNKNIHIRELELTIEDSDYVR